MADQQELDRSLDELEGWGPVPDDATPLVERVHTARHKPISTLTDDDLRLLIGQEISLDILLPRALDILESDPLKEATYYPGDLLAMVLKVPEAIWTAHPEFAEKLRAILDSVAEIPDDLAERVARFRGLDQSDQG